MIPDAWIPPSGSKLAVGETCPASMVLPRTHEEAGDAAELGTDFHSFVENVGLEVNRGKPLVEARCEALARVPADSLARPRCEALDLDALDFVPGALYEVGFSLDVAADVVTYHGTGHAHGTIDPRPGVIVGILDRVTDRPDLDRVDVDDWKTGFLPVPVKGNLQLIFGAVCAARHFGRSHARIRIVKCPEDGRPRPEADELDTFDLDLGLLRLAALVEKGREQARRLCAGEPLEYVQGKNCTYCRSFNACKPSMQAIVVMAREPLNVESEITGLIASGTDADAARAFEALEKWETVAKRIKIAIVTRARNRAIPFADGTVYGERVVTKTKLDGERVFETIVAHYGHEVAALTVKKKATKKGIEAAARLLVARAKEIPSPKGEKKPTIKAIGTAIFALLETRGASVEVPTRKLDRHKPGEATTDEDDDE